MTCNRPKVQLYLYLDGELAPSDAAEVEQHLQDCQVCQSEATAHHRLQTLLQTALPPEDVPDPVVSAIEPQLVDDAPVNVMPMPRWLSRTLLWSGAVAMAALLLFALGMRLWWPASVPLVVQEIVDSQIRAQLMNAPYDKVAADAGVIRRWFDGKVEFAPPLPAIPAEDYALVGVRLNYFLNRRVAEIAYTSRDHGLSFLMFADKNIALNATRSVRFDARTFHIHTHKGYSTILWQDGEIVCSLVSDLRPDELLQIARKATGTI